MYRKRETTVRNQRFFILKQPIASVSNQHLINYPTPSNLSYWWGLGSLVAMHYTPHVDLAFNIVEHIMRDVEGVGCFDIRMRTGLPCSLSSYIRTCSVAYIMRVIAFLGNLFCIGVVIFLLMILIAFIGLRSLGQMSFWGATFIASLASAIPVVGDTIVTWLWGVGASVLHLDALHQYVSNNPLGVHVEMDKIAFYPYFYVKDLVGYLLLSSSLAWIFYAPNVLGHPDNYIPQYHSSFICLSSTFYEESHVRSSSFRPIYQGLFWLLLADRCLLGWIGCQPVEPPFVTIGQISPFRFSCSLRFFLFRTCCVGILILTRMIP
ncbi:hypothetical protein MKW92_005774 [Papaver armeniacum]|nr:hypothetical protein MKW92_005774 [Papaver armeniacum]